MTLINLRLIAIGRSTTFGAFTSSSRSFSGGSNTCLSDADPFGFNRSQSNQSLKFRKPDSTPQQLNTPGTPASNQKQTTDRSPSLLDDRREDEDQSRRESYLDQLWKTASQLKIQSHFGPLTPASSRVVRTVRIPPNSFLMRPVSASDVERSYKKLSNWLKASGLRKEIYLNKRYEKPCLKRRRLASERHRRRFAIEVQRRVQIINVMRMKGM
ncbi:hypothetical protein PSTT_16474 [Puccinia striiformis]|uniref:Ribosomal protein S21 n=1 Tax=Puccinia striiformis TaxID=27350 RepID=A0A2S4UCT2_9BASI|nr:hypothetical protein PSTT_16474 [Puccinia striiformis]